MSTERDELRGTLANTICNASFYPDRALPYLLGGDMSTVLNKTADALLEAGYRKPHTITTVEELEALADGAVVMGDWATYQLVFGRWVTLGGPAVVAVELPVTVIHDGWRKAG